MNRVWALVAASGLAQAACGQVLWNNAAGGSWGIPGNWNPIGIPNSSTTDVEFPLAATTNTSITPQVRAISLTNSQARLEVANSSGLNIHGAVTNQGQIVVNPTSGGNNTYLQFDGGVTMNGLGSLVLNANPGNLDTGYVAALTAGNLINGSSHTITGRGRLYMPLQNNGTLLCDGAGNVIDVPGVVSNDALIKATNGGTVQLRNTVTQGGGGVLRAESGGAIALYSVTYTGGVIEAAGGTVNPVAGVTSTLNITSYTGSMAIPNSSGVNIASAGYVHNGTVTVNPTAGGNNSYINFLAAGTVRGSGCTIALNANAGNLDTGYVTGANPMILDASARIIGRGRIYGTWTNNGLIESSGAGNFLDFAGVTTNNSIIRASNGGYLTLRNHVTQAAPGVLDAAGGDLYFYSANYVGGRITTSGGGHLYPVSGAVPRFDVQTIDGDIPIPNSSGVRFAGAGAQVNGTITVNPTSGGNNTYVFFENAGPLSGNADIVLNANPANLDTGYVGGNGLLTLPAGNTITGRGRVYSTLQNNGFIGVAGAGNVMDVAGVITNSGLMRCENGGTFTLHAPMTQNGGGQLVADASPVYLYSNMYTGGMYSAVNGGSIEVVTGAVTTLSNVTTSGPINIPNSSGLRIASSGWEHAGTITVNPTAGGNNSYLIFNVAGTYSGNNTIVLNANPANLDTAYVQAAGGTVTIPPTSTVRGIGRIYGSFVNMGQMLTSGTGNSLDFTGGAIDNQSVIRASNGAALTLREPITQGASARIEGVDSTIYLYGTSYTGGRMLTTGTGEIDIVGGSTLNSVQLDAPVRLPNSMACTVTGGTLIHNGDWIINPTAGGNGTSVTFSGPMTVSGTGVWRLNAHPANFDTAILTQSGGTTQFNKGLVGHGRIYSPMTLHNVVSPDSSGSDIGTIDFRAPLTLGTGTRFDVQIGMGSQCDRLTSSSPVTLGGDLVVSFAPGYSPAFDDQFTIITGSAVSGNFVHETLPGLPDPHWKWVILINSNNVKVIIGCGSDYNSDGNIDLFDYLDFVNVFSQGGPDADFNLDGVVDFFDYLDFVDSFARPC